MAACGNCGAVVSETTKFCGACGHPVSTDAQAPPRRRRSTSPAASPAAPASWSTSAPTQPTPTVGSNPKVVRVTRVNGGGGPNGQRQVVAFVVAAVAVLLVAGAGLAFVASGSKSNPTVAATAPTVTLSGASHEMPAVTEFTLDQAKASLEQAGISASGLTIKNTPSEDHAPGTVLEQFLIAGASVSATSRIRLTALAYDRVAAIELSRRRRGSFVLDVYAFGRPAAVRMRLVECRQSSQNAGRFRSESAFDDFARILATARLAATPNRRVGGVRCRPVRSAEARWRPPIAFARCAVLLSELRR